MHLEPLPNVHGNLAQSLALPFGRHEVIPGRDRLDALRQIFQVRPRLGAAGIPQSPVPGIAGIRPLGLSLGRPGQGLHDG